MRCPIRLKLAAFRPTSLQAVEWRGRHKLLRLATVVGLFRPQRDVARRLLALTLVTITLNLGCGSSVAEPPTAPSGNSSVVLDLTVNTAGAFAGMGLIYVFCGSITPQGGQNGVRLLSLEFTPRGAAGQPYFTWVDRILGESPRDIHGGESGCFGSMSDPVVGRAAASTFAAKVGYASGGRTRIAEFSGPVVRPP